MTRIDSEPKLETGMIVGFVARMRKNPVLEAIETLLGAAELAESFSELSSKKPELPGKKKERQQPESGVAILIRKLRNFHERAASGDFVDIIGDLTGSSYVAVISLEKEYLSDPKMSDEEAKTVFDDPLYVDFYDPDHSVEEHRYLIAGQSRQGRVLIVSYTERGETARLISAREVTSTERKAYEEG